jgi:hypothetical protein
MKYGPGRGNPPQVDINHNSYNTNKLSIQRNCQEIFRPRRKTKAKRFLGGYAEGVTPVPIPNTEVKPLRADDTARVAVWESRSPPGIKQKAPHPEMVAGLLRFCNYMLK